MQRGRHGYARSSDPRRHLKPHPHRALVKAAALLQQMLKLGGMDEAETGLVVALPQLLNLIAITIAQLENHHCLWRERVEQP